MPPGRRCSVRRWGCWLFCTIGVTQGGGQFAFSTFQYTSVAVHKGVVFCTWHVSWPISETLRRSGPSMGPNHKTGGGRETLKNKCVHSPLINNGLAKLIVVWLQCQTNSIHKLIILQLINATPLDLSRRRIPAPNPKRDSSLSSASLMWGRVTKCRVRFNIFLENNGQEMPQKIDKQLHYRTIWNEKKKGNVKVSSLVNSSDLSELWTLHRNGAHWLKLNQGANSHYLWSLLATSTSIVTVKRGLIRIPVFPLLRQSAHFEKPQPKLLKQI